MANGDFNRRKAYWWVALTPSPTKADGLKVLSDIQGSGFTQSGFAYSFDAADGETDPNRISEEVYELPPGSTVGDATIPANRSAVVSQILNANSFILTNQLSLGRFHGRYNAFLQPYLPD